MAITNTRAAFVNRSSVNIPIAKDLVDSNMHTGGLTTGQTKGHYMQFYKKKVGTSWVNLCPGGYGFVDLGFDVGSKPNNRAIY